MEEERNEMLALKNDDSKGNFVVPVFYSASYQ